MSTEELQPANMNDVQKATRSLDRSKVPEDLPVSTKSNTQTIKAASQDKPSADTAQVAAGLKPKSKLAKSKLSYLIASSIILLAAGAAYILIDQLWKEEKTDKPSEEKQKALTAITPGAPFTRSKKLQGVKTANEIYAPLPGIDPNKVYLEPTKDKIRKQLENVDYALISSSSRSVSGSQNSDEIELKTQAESDFLRFYPKREKPLDRQFERESKSASYYLPAGEDPHAYFVRLRNQLHKPVHADVDLEKAYILLSQYYNPELDPDLYRAYLNDLATELYNRLAPLNTEGFRKKITDGREQVAIISEFMLHGLGPFFGWDVQEYHPGLSGVGTPLEKQNYLIDQVLGPAPQGHKLRNQAAHTALNLLTLILVRKLESDIADPEMKLRIPLYGVRLPDRTILRYDPRGPNLLVPHKEREVADFYSRNLEFLRNGNHYDGEDYIQRYSLSDSDLHKGIYLKTLGDKDFFATLGYELARVEVLKNTQKNYRRARTLLEEWVLDKDDGSIMNLRAPGKSRIPHNDPKNYRTKPHMSLSRGDTSLRDAYILYAEMMLQQADYEGLKTQIEVNEALRQKSETVKLLKGIIAQASERLESAEAYLLDVLDLTPENARAHLYLGDIAFLLSRASAPASLELNEGAQILERGRHPLQNSLYHFQKAEAYDQGTLSGDERFLLHFHRALAYQAAGDLLPALEDIRQVGTMNPRFARTPRFDKISQRLKIDRAFQVLEAPSNTIAQGDLKFSALNFLEETLMLEPEHMADFLRTASIFESSNDNIALEWEISAFLHNTTGQNFSRDADAWKSWIEDYFAQNP